MSYTIDSLEQQLAEIKKQYNSLGGIPFQPQSQANSQNGFQLSMPQQPIIPHQVKYVDGFNGAKMYQNNLPPNASEIIMDKNEDIFYMVSKDANGIPSKNIVRGRFTIEETNEEEPAFLTKKDLEEFKEEIKKMFTSKNNSQTTTTIKKEQKEQQ